MDLENEVSGSDTDPEYVPDKTDLLTAMSSLKKHLGYRHPEVRSMLYEPNLTTTDISVITVPSLTSSVSNCEENSVSDRTTVSVAWEHFEKLENDMAQCKYCQNQLSYKTSVTNLLEHLLHKHSGILAPSYKSETPKIHRIPSNDKSVSSLNASDSRSKGKTRKIVSVAWKHFKKLKHYNAQCNYCQKRLSYKSAIGNLQKHLQRKHSDILKSLFEAEKAKDGTKDCSGLSLNVTDFRLGSRISVSWKHFEKLEGFRARCNYCQNQLSYKAGVSNLQKHVQRKHSDVLTFNDPEILDTPRMPPDDNSDTSTTASDDSIRLGNRTSVVWKHFVKLENFMARCNYCQNQLSYKTGVSNLQKHVQRKHSDVFTIYEPDILDTPGMPPDDNSDSSTNVSDASSSEDNPVPTRTNVSKAWKHFKKLENYMAQCKYCQNKLSYRTVSGLTKHIKRKHSEVLEPLYEPEIPEIMSINNLTKSQIETSLSNPKRQGNKPSPIWEHFKKISDHLAKCNYCGKELSYNSCMKTLRKHLKRVHLRHPPRSYCSADAKEIENGNSQDDPFRHTHPIENEMEIDYLEDFEADDILATDRNCSDNENPSNKIVLQRNRSDVWKYFVQSEDEANCKICNQLVTCKSVSNLKYHIIKEHGKIEFADAKSSDEEKEENLECRESHDQVQKLPNLDIKRKKRDQKGTLIRKRRSPVWKYFSIKDHVHRVATCKMCYKDLSYVSTIGNLMKHIRRTHHECVLNADDEDEKQDVKVDVPLRLSQPNEKETEIGRLEDFEDDISMTDSDKKETVTSGRSQVWKYYVPKDPVKRVATCKICRKDLSYLSTIGNLMKHIRGTHSKEKYVLNDEDESQVIKVNGQELKLMEQKHSRKFRSSIWKYFDVQDRAKKKAKCRLCKCNFIYTCLSNLNKHLTRKHGVVANAEESEMEIVTTSPVWAYFKCLDETLKIASCLICKKRIEYNGDSDLTKHLSRKHPHVDFEEIRNKPKKLMITDNGDIYEIDDDDVAKQEPESQDNDNDSDDWNNHNNEIEALHSTEFIDEEMMDDPVLTPVAKKRKRSSNITNSNVQQKQEECSIEIFGKYVVSLLKKLPKHKADRLQAEFVRQIMEAQLNDDINISSNENTRYNNSQVENSRYDTSIRSQVQNRRYVDNDTHVTSNSEVQRVITRDGEMQNSVTNGHIIVTSAGAEITVETT